MQKNSSGFLNFNFIQIIIITMRNFFTRIVLLTALFTVLLSWTPSSKPVREFYQLTIYHYNNHNQRLILDNYLQQALLPALHRIGIKQVGVFSSLGNDTLSDKLLYVLIPVKKMDWVVALDEKLTADTLYQTAGAAYINAVYTNPPYSRIETLLLRAFSRAPELQQPSLNAPKKERVYELRSYESATEKIFRNKVQMFNEGDEIGLFKRLNFNAVFYGEVLSGCKMPNLMYMTSFENMADREAHWKRFVDDPYWKKLSSLPEYQHNVSHIDITFLQPADYSDF